jgi:hypothetical protein
MIPLLTICRSFRVIAHYEQERPSGVGHFSPSPWVKSTPPSIREAFSAFIQALAHFTHTHDGEARLESMIPDEAVLSIRRLDMARHLLAEAQVGCWHYVRGRAFFNRVSVTFELDPSQLPDIVRSLAAVIDDAEQS